MSHRAHFFSFGGHKVAFWSVLCTSRLYQDADIYVQMSYFIAFFCLNSRSRLFTIRICENCSGIKVQDMKIYVTSSDIRTFPQKILYSSISSKKLNVEKFLTRCTEVEECVFCKKSSIKNFNMAPAQKCLPSFVTCKIKI